MTPEVACKGLDVVTSFLLLAYVVIFIGYGLGKLRNV